MRKLAVAIIAVLLLAGCGVGTSGATDLGDALDAGRSQTTGVAVPTPNLAGSAPDKLVRLYLAAAVGGGDAGRTQMAAFLTDQVPPPQTTQNPAITVIRILATQVGAATLDGIPVTVTYQVVGTLNDQGRVDELTDLKTAQMQFTVVPYDLDETTLRINSIVDAPPGLLLSDDALTEYYTPHPVYFWDSVNSLLVPDIRYLPLTLPRDQQSNQVIRWLQGGPSPWLTGAQRLPNDTFADTFVSPRDDGGLKVTISAQAATDPDALHRLIYQLQWSLGRTDFSVFVEDQQVGTDVGSDDRARYNYATIDIPAPLVYDISADQTVVGDASPASGVLASDANTAVVWAAVDRTARNAALVRLDGNGRRYLELLANGGTSVVTADLAHSLSMGRPAEVPETGGQVLVPSGGHLWAVAAATGVATDVTPRNLTSVTAISVSADGRRVALIAGGEAYVASLIVSATSVTVGSTLRPILAGQLTATAVAWTGESWLTVAGAGSALWRVTADGVVADNISSALGGVTVTDMVAYPPWPADGIPEIFVNTANGVYSLGSTIVPSQKYHAPFFAF